ncbi:MAG: hypothetical protein KUG67_03885 [Proteobacteria bacterium]|nr:hypothetical protein [Pseudomonadota bacterium]
MIDEIKSKIAALAGLAGVEEEVQEEPQDLIAQIKARKDARRDDIEGRIDSGEYVQEGVNDREVFEDTMNAGLSQEDKERAAAESVAKKRKAAGIMDPEEDQEARRVLLNREINK